MTEPAHDGVGRANRAAGAVWFVLLALMTGGAVAFTALTRGGDNGAPVAPGVLALFGFATAFVAVLIARVMRLLLGAPPKSDHDGDDADPLA